MYFNSGYLCLCLFNKQKNCGQHLCIIMCFINKLEVDCDCAQATLHGEPVRSMVQFN